MSLVWPAKFANTLSFYAKQIWCLRIYGKCVKILWKCGKTRFKTCVFEKLCISYSCILFIFFNDWRSLCTKLGCFSKLCFFFFFFRISIDRSYFSINRNCFKNFKWASICFDQSNIRFRSIENRMRSFLKTDFQLSQTLFQKVL